MVTTLGTILGTTLGTELGGMQDVAGFDTRLLYALSNLSAANYYATQTGAGELGNASFLTIVLARQRTASVAVNQALYSNYSGTPYGYRHFFGAGQGFIFHATVNGAVSVTPTIATTPSDVGKVRAFVGQVEPGFVKQCLDRQLRGSVATAGSYTSGSGRPHELGTWATAWNAESFDILAHASFWGTPSDAQVDAYLDQARALGDLPPSMAGATIRHRWSLRDVLAALDLPVTDGQTAPATIPDSITAATVDAMGRQGSPVVRTIDPGIDGRRTYGALGLTAANYLRGSANTTLSSATAYWAAFYGIPYTNAVGGFTYRWLMDGGNWNIYIANGATVVIGAQNGAKNAASGTVTAAMVGQPCVIHAVFTPAGIEAFVNGVSTGAAVAATDTPTSRTLYLGAKSDLTAWANDWTVLGAAQGRFALTAQDAADHYARCLAAGRMVAIGGKTERLYDLTSDVIANGGPDNGIPATAQDRIGTDPLTKVGSLYIAQRVERTWSYETRPIIRGMAKGTSTAYARTAPGAGIVGSASGWHLNVLFRLLTRSIASSRHIISSVAAGSGYAFYASTNNSVISTLMVNGAGSNILGTGITMTDADLGKLHLATIAFDPGLARIRVFARRVELTQAAITGYTPSVSYMDVGNGNGSGAPLEGIAWLGASGGVGVPSLAQYQALWDACLATEDIQGIPGMTDHLYSPTRSLAENGGAWPAQIIDRVGTDHMTVTGVPDIDQVYARAWAA